MTENLHEHDFILFGNAHFCDKCREVAEHMNDIGIDFIEGDAEDMIDHSDDADKILDMITNNDGRIPFIKCGNFMFGYLGDVIDDAHNIPKHLEDEYHKRRQYQVESYHEMTDRENEHYKGVEDEI